MNRYSYFMNAKGDNIMDSISLQNSSTINTKTIEVTNSNKSEASGKARDTNSQDFQAPKASTKEPSKEAIDAVLKDLNDMLKPHQTSVKYKHYEKLNENYVQVVDDKTNQVIKEIPSKKMLDFYSSMLEFIGVLVDKKI
jgi:flagellar protein FlaG